MILGKAAREILYYGILTTSMSTNISLSRVFCTLFHCLEYLFNESINIVPYLTRTPQHPKFTDTILYDGNKSNYDTNGLSILNIQ